jgi:hypothetical protein
MREMDYLWGAFAEWLDKVETLRPKRTTLFSAYAAGHDSAEARATAAHAQLERARGLLELATSCIWHHHEASYRPELGNICPVCCPDGDPFKSVLTEISEFLMPLRRVAWNGAKMSDDNKWTVVALNAMVSGLIADLERERSDHAKTKQASLDMRQRDWAEVEHLRERVKYWSGEAGSFQEVAIENDKRATVAENEVERLRGLLERLRQWDMMSVADGPHWKREIAALLAATAPGRPDTDGGAVGVSAARK